MPTHAINISGKFRSNHYTVYGYTVSREIGVNSGRMNGLPVNSMPFPPIIVGGGIKHTAPSPINNIHTQLRYKLAHQITVPAVNG